MEVETSALQGLRCFACEPTNSHLHGSPDLEGPQGTMLGVCFAFRYMYNMAYTVL